METAHRFERHQGPSNIHQNLSTSEKWTIKRQVRTNPLQSIMRSKMTCLSCLGVCGLQTSV